MALTTRILRRVIALRAQLGPEALGLPFKNELRRFTMCDEAALRNICRIARHVVESGVPGHAVECGVCNGGTAAIIAGEIKNTTKELWLYDSFRGMPNTTARDGDAAETWVSKCIGSEESVKEALRIVGFPPERLQIRKGWFQDTLACHLPSTISLLHIDADWYESVLLCLNILYDRVTEGGVVILDDFGCWEGCREAFYDFCGPRHVCPLIERSGPQQAYWVKGRLHNRKPL